MSRITGKIISDLEEESALEVEQEGASLDFLPVSWKDTPEPTKETYNRLAKKLNDYLMYGHLPKKDSK